jgi:aminocarboxymuconate-semialdehyde decarboxylase
MLTLQMAGKESRLLGFMTLKGGSMKIDIYNHVLPARYKKALWEHSDKFIMSRKAQEKRPALTDYELRFRVLDEYEDIVQVVTTASPPLGDNFGPKEAAELARIANDEMAELVAKYPQKCIGAVANLPLNNIDAALKETERAVKELGFKGIEIYSSVQGRPLSSKEFIPLYEMMSGLDLPIWIHNLRRPERPDYPTEYVSHNQIYSTIGGPYEISAAMTRLVFAGVFEKFPNIKFIAHHRGGMIPYLASRIVIHYNDALDRMGLDYFPGLTKEPIEYFRMFYVDTGTGLNRYELMCVYDFFGEDHVLFGTDFPYDVEQGAIKLREGIKAIDSMDIPESSKKKIYEGNARNLLHL